LIINNKALNNKKTKQRQPPDPLQTYPGNLMQQEPKHADLKNGHHDRRFTPPGLK